MIKSTLLIACVFLASETSAADPRDQTITYWRGLVRTTRTVRAPRFKAPRNPQTPFERYWHAQEVLYQRPVDHFSVSYNWNRLIGLDE